MYTTTSSSTSSTHQVYTTTTTSSSTYRPTTTRTTSTTYTTLSSTSTTRQYGHFTRTPGFYKNHPDVTQDIITHAGGLMVCGHAITDVSINSGHSALEAMCVSPHGDVRLQLLRQLVAAELNLLSGSTASYGGYAACDAVCRDGHASAWALSSCVSQTDAFNNSGDSLVASFDPPGAADPTPCDFAAGTTCTVLSPEGCTAP